MNEAYSEELDEPRSHEMVLTDRRDKVIARIFVAIEEESAGAEWNLATISVALRSRISNLGGIRGLGSLLPQELKDKYLPTSQRVVDFLNGEADDSELEQARIQYVLRLEDAISDLDEWKFNLDEDSPTDMYVLGYKSRYFETLFDLIPYLSDSALLRWTPHADDVKLAVYIELERRGVSDQLSHDRLPLEYRVLVEVRSYIDGKGVGYEFMYNDLKHISKYYLKVFNGRGGLKYFLQIAPDDIIFSMTSTRERELRLIICEQFKRCGVEITDEEVSELIKFRSVLDLSSKVNSVELDGQVKPIDLLQKARIHGVFRVKHKTEEIFPYIHSDALRALIISVSAPISMKSEYASEIELRKLYPSADKDLRAMYLEVSQFRDGWYLMDLSVYFLEINLEYFDILFSRLPEIYRRMYIGRARQQAPKTRAECIEGHRPCPFTTCRHHMIRAISADRILKMTLDEVNEMTSTCVLDVTAANPDGLTLEAIGSHLGVTKETVRNIELRALNILRANGITLEEFLGEDS
jgi:hypothetical protein